MTHKVTGVMVYYYHVCKRKLWYFSHEIQMEQENENVKIGKILDENSYNREDKHINIDNIINIDFIKSQGVIHEVKKSKKIEEASIWQVKYYLYYLKARGVGGLRAKIDYPLLKQTVEIDLSDEDEKYIKDMLLDIENLIGFTTLPELEKKRICKACAYYDLCFV